MGNNDFIIVSFAVIDTNVLVSSMLGNKPSATKDIINYISSDNIIPLFDQRMLDEYNEVLQRFFTEDVIKAKLQPFLDKGFLVADVEETKEFFADKDDIPFFEVKESAKELEPYLITGNTKHYPPETTRTASFVVEVMKYLNNFVIRDRENYLQNISSLIDSLDKSKYIKIENDANKENVSFEENLFKMSVGEIPVPEKHPEKNTMTEKTLGQEGMTDRKSDSPYLKY